MKETKPLTSSEMIRKSWFDEADVSQKPDRYENNRKHIVGILRSMNGNRENRRKYEKVSLLQPGGYGPKMYKQRFYDYPSIWPKTLMLDSINIEGHKFQPLTAIFNDDVVFFMHIDITRAKNSPVLKDMNFITGSPEDAFAVFHRRGSKSSMLLEFSEGNICLNRRLLSSYQEVANYLATKLRVNLVPRRPKKTSTWNTTDEYGQSIAFTKREATDYVNMYKDTNKSILMYSNGKVTFFANPEAQVGFPEEFVSINWSNFSEGIEGVMAANNYHGKFIFSSTNVAQYLNAHYS